MSAMPRYDPEELLRVYERHPLSERRILARVRESNPSLSGVTELDLAIDEHTEITDQNHIGGYEFVLQLGAHLELAPGKRVLDVGCGLGGPARALAAFYGAQVHGVDISPTRIASAERLARLVGLEGLATFTCGDFFDLDLPQDHYHAVIGQSSFVHFADKRRLVASCARVLRRGGRLAVEDSYLAREGSGVNPVPKLGRLEELWLSHFVTLDEWTGIERECGLTPRLSEDLTPAFVRYFRRLAEVTPEPPIGELEAWRLAVELGSAGLVRYARTVSVRG